MRIGFKAECLVETAEKLLKSRAEAGDKQASFLLGHLYYEEVIIHCFMLVRLCSSGTVKVWIALVDF